MLETSDERVELLKAGIPGKIIEELYISGNNIKILKRHVLFELNHDKLLSLQKRIRYHNRK
jgi:DNA-binding CsgD family transcriptional regulator